jgi:pyruvate,orthophosphate dikinase
MAKAGVRVPPGLVIPTTVCRDFWRGGGAKGQQALPDGLMDEVFDAIARVVEPAVGDGRRFGDADNPLLLSVRSGAAVSMPGCMDTVLDLGLNDVLVEGLARRTNPRFAYDWCVGVFFFFFLSFWDRPPGLVYVVVLPALARPPHTHQTRPQQKPTHKTTTTTATTKKNKRHQNSYRRLLQMYGDVVLGIPSALFEAELSAVKQAAGRASDVDLSADELRDLVARYKRVYAGRGAALPSDPREQLRAGVHAVFASWNTPRAIRYREIKAIRGLLGTAVNVQAMVFGNAGPSSGSGVLFTRSPVDGSDVLFGEYLLNAQGEEVVAGTRTPSPLSELARQMPAVYEELRATVKGMERSFGDAQDVEMTIESGCLWILQTRTGKRTGRAALRIALDMAREGVVSEAQAVRMVEPAHLDQLLHPVFADPEACARAAVAKGLAASPGAAVGRLVFSSEDAEAWAARGERVVLVRHETSSEDVGGMHAAQAIATSTGGMTSHAAVIARGWGKPCVCGCAALEVDPVGKTLSIATATAAASGDGDGNGNGSGNDNGHHPPHHDPATDVVLKEGDWISVDGTTGDVIVGEMAVKPPGVSGDLAAFLALADARRNLRVLANADTPEDAAIARANGAEGIGLVRTEHMFFGSPERLAAVRRAIAALQLGGGGGDAGGGAEGGGGGGGGGPPSAAAAALAELEAFQTQDFEGIFVAMDGLPVTVRLLDPPLSEFLPTEGPALRELAERLAAELPGSPAAHDVAARLADLREVNPMMGLRGCRLGVVYPELTRMQARAVARGALAAAGRTKQLPRPSVMVPLVAFAAEFRAQSRVVRAEMGRLLEGSGVRFDVGTMIEVPRAALVAGELAGGSAAASAAAGGGNGNAAEDDDGAAFFSIGSNDLTQMTCGLSRDDAQAKFLRAYLDAGVLAADPFAELDPAVGELVRMATERGRAARPGLEVGVCGEQGGEPASIAFFEELGLSYVSVSAPRVPIARLAAAQAALALEEKKKKQKEEDKA